MKFATLYAYDLLKTNESSTHIMKELFVMQRHQLVTPAVVDYILKKRDIPLSFYKASYQALNQFNHYSKERLVEPVPS